MEINVKKFIQDNYTEYLGDESFLQPLSERNRLLWNKCKKLLNKEKEAGGVLDINTKTFSGINNFKPTYIDKKLELIYGFQGDKPLQRIMNPYGGLRMVEKSLKAYGYKMPEHLKKQFLQYRKTHNDGVFDVYTPEILKARHNKLLTGLPDAYGRGRIIGDYRRVALYGIDILIDSKKKDLKTIEDIQLREEIAEQIKALYQIQKLAESYNCDVSKPAQTAREAIQAIYFAYLAGAKENNGAATSLGRVSTFIDIYIERDLESGVLKSESHAQELIDQFIMKLRFIRHLRTPEYDELFAGDPTWVTESIGGMNDDGRSFVTKTSFRFLHSLNNLETAPEPNLTILWHKDLPECFKIFCAKMSIKTSSIQYENDELMTELAGNDYGIACCVSCMRLGEQMQFFGARCNIAKVLLYAINGGVDEITGERVIPDIPYLTHDSEGFLDYELVKKNFLKVLEYTIKIYVQANNMIHYMHDKYAYEASQMALHDSKVDRLMAFGIAGFSVVVDSLSAIKNKKVKVKKGIPYEYEIIGDYPCFGNNEDEVDNIAIDILNQFYNILKTYKLYRNAKPTLSILTITSNVVYGKNTGATPDGRGAHKPFSPGANPMHGREKIGMLAAMGSISKLPYMGVCEDGISYTVNILPSSLGSTVLERQLILRAVIDAYMSVGGHHLNINFLDKWVLEDALKNPGKYPNLTVRISGYAVRFDSLTEEQKLEILSRTFHEEAF